jgi:hypothetical protein
VPRLKNFLTLLTLAQPGYFFIFQTFELSLSASATNFDVPTSHFWCIKLGSSGGSKQSNPKTREAFFFKEHGFCPLRDIIIRARTPPGQYKNCS